jgi:hypothetical protein
MPTKFVNIRSADRDSGSSSDFSYTLSQPVKYPRRISLESVELPLMIHNCRSPYNTFSWTEGGESKIASVTAGNYSITELLTALGTAMNAVTTNTYTFTKSDTTQKVSVTSTNSITIGSSYLSKHLGFVSGQAGTSITATNSYSLNVPDMYYGIQTNFSSNYDSKSSPFSYKVPIAVDAGYIQYHLKGSTFEQHVDVDLDKLAQVSLRLVDYYGTVCSLNGLDWSLTFRIDYDAASMA